MSFDWYLWGRRIITLITLINFYAIFIENYILLYIGLALLFAGNLFLLLRDDYKLNEMQKVSIEMIKKVCESCPYKEFLNIEKRE
jgi:hypothetical protein